MIEIDLILTPFTASEARRILGAGFKDQEVRLVEALLKKSVPLPERKLSPISFSNFFDLLEATLLFNIRALLPDIALGSDIVSDFLDSIGCFSRVRDTLDASALVDFTFKELELTYPKSILKSLRLTFISSIEAIELGITGALWDSSIATTVTT